MKRIVLSVMAAFALLTISQAQEKRYGVERAVIKQSSEMMGQKISIVQYIDDWGEKEATETLTSMGGQTMHVVAITKDGVVYTANLTAKQGAKIDMKAMDNYQNINYLNLTDEVKKKYSIKDEGKEKFLNRECNKYGMSVSQNGQTVGITVWVWKGIVLKSQVSVMGQTITQAATEVMEVPSIPAARFELPAGIEFKDMTPKK